MRIIAILFLICFDFGTMVYAEPQLKYSMLLDDYPWAGDWGYILTLPVGADVDENGNLYVAMYCGPLEDRYLKVIKINPAGSSVEIIANLSNISCSKLVYQDSTLIIQSGGGLIKINLKGEIIYNIDKYHNWYSSTIDDSGNIYSISSVNSKSILEYPLTEDAFDSTMNGDEDLYLTIHDSAGNLSYGSFYGGPDLERYGYISLDRENRVCLFTKVSEGFPFNIENAPVKGRASNVFMRFSHDLKNIEYSVYVDPVYHISSDNGDKCKYDGKTNAYYYSFFTFQTKPALPFVVKLTADCEFVWGVTFFHGYIGPFPHEMTTEASFKAYPRSIQIDRNGDIYTTFELHESGFPVTVDSYLQNFQGDIDFAITRLSNDGELLYSTYWGGSGRDEVGWHTTVVKDGVFYCVGHTSSPEFPVTTDTYRNSVPNSETDTYFAFALDFNDDSTHVTGETAAAPAPLILDPPHPNPFNPATTISFTLSEAAHVKLAVYNTSGQLVRELATEMFTAGQHEFVWDGSDDSGTAVSSGIYFARLATGGRTAVRRMVLVR